MTMPEVIATGALVLMGGILLLLLLQCVRLNELWRVAQACREGARWARIWEMENRELRAALRAEQVRVAALRRRLQGAVVEAEEG
ncbi:hypothetical protein DCO48_06555 [Pseudomonas sp. SDI]|uniref:hypothetical protein n=1 Tax=Pseudomonas sp. SDI TaxID=2170734 RepID=UPI000DE6B53E|nr:hypothetical protein [Pseudomonas sp. SDI]PWB34356.1 hypothetical protein DCO48_06555 [Pseudomonas sp. SDI]